MVLRAVRGFRARKLLATKLDYRGNTRREARRHKISRRDRYSYASCAIVKEEWDCTLDALWIALNGM